MPSFQLLIYKLPILTYFPLSFLSLFIQQFRTTIDALQERIADLERINVDLEYRLEDQARQCMDVEKECMAIKREWASKCDILQAEIEHWKNEHLLEQTKSTKLREQNSRTERELYRILQRKYELMRGNVAQNKSSQGLNEVEKELLPTMEEKPQVCICIYISIHIFIHSCIYLLLIILLISLLFFLL